MPDIRLRSDLRRNAAGISEFCHQTGEPIFITKNGTGDMGVMSLEAYEKQRAILDQYSKLAEAEEEITAGAEGIGLSEVTKRLRNRVHGPV